jgi:hypothetical protein
LPDAQPGVERVQLAAMLGGRSYASSVIQSFKAEGIVETRRGSFFVCDHGARLAKSCLCDPFVSQHFAELVGSGVYPEPFNICPGSSYILLRTDPRIRTLIVSSDR